MSVLLKARAPKWKTPTKRMTSNRQVREKKPSSAPIQKRPPNISRHGNPYSAMLWPSIRLMVQVAKKKVKRIRISRTKNRAARFAPGKSWRVRKLPPYRRGRTNSKNRHKFQNAWSLLVSWKTRRATVAAGCTKSYLLAEEHSTVVGERTRQHSKSQNRRSVA